MLGPGARDGRVGGRLILIASGLTWKRRRYTPAHRVPARRQPVAAMLGDAAPQGPALKAIHKTGTYSLIRFFEAVLLRPFGSILPIKFSSQPARHGLLATRCR